MGHLRHKSFGQPHLAVKSSSKKLMLFMSGALFPYDFDIPCPFLLVLRSSESILVAACMLSKRSECYKDVASDNNSQMETK